MENQTKVLFGSWVQASGTFVAAVGSTPTKRFTEEQFIQLLLIGNVLQAVGHGIVAGFTEDEFQIIGNKLQAIGNSTVISGLLLDLPDTTKLHLFVKGNLIQALGGFTEIGEGFEQKNGGKPLLIMMAGFLQGIGNSLQALGGMKELQSEGSESAKSLEFVGSWIQTIGAVLAVIEETKEWVNENQKTSSDSFVFF